MASFCTDTQKLDRINEASKKESMEYMGFFSLKAKLTIPLPNIHFSAFSMLFSVSTTTCIQAFLV
jgi:hypothetical protein